MFGRAKTILVGANTVLNDDNQNVSYYTFKVTIMPNKDGVEACREIIESLPGTRVIMLTASTDEDAVIEAMSAGATGYLQKVAGKDRLLATIRDVAAGELRVPTDIVMRTIGKMRDGAEWGEDPKPHLLTQRELEILKSFTRGASYTASWASHLIRNL